MIGAVVYFTVALVSGADSRRLENKLPGKTPEQLESASGVANGIYNKLLHHYSNLSSFDSISDAIASGISKEQVVFSYPDNYAGAYFDADKEKLVVCTTGKRETLAEELTSFLNASEMEAVSLKRVKYSYTDIMEAYAHVIPRFCEQYPGLIRDYMIRFTENRIVISIKHKDKEAVEVLVSMLEDAIEKDATTIVSINVAELEEIVELSSTVPSGTAVYNRPSLTLWGQYSIGFRAKKVVDSETIYGFVTAAHGTQNTINANWKLEMNIFAEVFGTIDSYTYNASVDAAFISLSGTNLVSTSIANYNGTYLPYAFLEPTENSTVFKSGCATGYGSGTVLSNNHTNPDVGTTGIYENILTTLSCDEGDSGGIVFAPLNGMQYVVGIVRAKYISGPYLGKTIVCDGWDIMGALGLQAWGAN